MTRREQIARIVDPKAWEVRDYNLRCEADRLSWNTKEGVRQAPGFRKAASDAVADSLAKADQIMGLEEAALTASQAEVERLTNEIARRDAVAKASWGDQKDQHTDAIRAAHPTYTKDFETYEAALAMVGTRHGKYELVNMANWLLARATRAEGLLEEAEKKLEASVGAHTKLLREWMYAPFPKEAQVLGGMSPPKGPFADAAASIEAARAFLDKLKEQG